METKDNTCIGNKHVAPENVHSPPKESFLVWDPNLCFPSYFPLKTLALAPQHYMVCALFNY